MAPLLVAMPDLPPVKVEVQFIQKGVHAENLYAIGVLRARQSVDIVSEVAGRVMNVPYKEGERVAKGTVLVHLEARTQEALLKQAQAKYALAKQQYIRKQQLFERGVGSASERDDAKALCAVAEADVALAEAQLEKMTLRAPFDGVVGLDVLSVGGYIQPAQVLLTLHNPDLLQVDFELPEQWMPTLTLNQSIQLQIPAVKQRVEARIQRIEPYVDPRTQTFKVRAEIPNADHTLKAGLFTKITIPLQAHSGITIPLYALQQEEGHYYVYQIVQGLAQKKNIRVGWKGHSWVEVLEGLQEGDQIVIHGALKLSPGRAVQVVPS